MLNGIDPLFLFQFSKLATGLTLPSVPVLSDSLGSFIEQPPIPLYLSETLTGLFIDTEDKTVEINTDLESKANGGEPDVIQKAVSSIIAINLKAKKDSIGMAVLSAFIDLVFEKVSSKEYSITYIHGATTVFRGVLHSYNVTQNANDDLLLVKIEISKGSKNPTKPNPVPELAKDPGEVNLNDANPAANKPTGSPTARPTRIGGRG